MQIFVKIFVYSVHINQIFEPGGSSWNIIFKVTANVTRNNILRCIEVNNILYLYDIRATHHIGTR